MGTNFEAPLTRVMQLVDKPGTVFEKSDVVFVTDGEAPISDSFKIEFNNWKEEKKVYLYSILIDSGGWSSTASLKEFTKEENIIKVTDMAEDTLDNTASSIFEGI